MERGMPVEKARKILAVVEAAPSPLPGQLVRILRRMEVWKLGG